MQLSIPSEAPLAEVVLSSASSEEGMSPCERACNYSFASITSLGVESDESARDYRGVPFSSLKKFDEEPNEEEEECEETRKNKASLARRQRLLNAPSRVDLQHDRQRILSARQNRLNNFILRQSKAAAVGRQDHHMMLRQLIGEAYFRDRRRSEHREQWRKILVAIRKEYWGANAIFTLSPDPYHNVLATLSSMMLWNDNARHWDYRYYEEEVGNRRARQEAVLESLRRSGKLFL